MDIERQTNYTEHDLGVAKEIASLKQQVSNVHDMLKEGFESLRVSLSDNHDLQNIKLETFRDKIAHLDDKIEKMQKVQSRIMTNQVKIFTIAAVSGASIAGLITLAEKIHLLFG